MNILIASSASKRREGGVAGVVHNLAEELEKLGHQVVCLFLEDILDRPVFPKRLENVYFATRVAAFVLRDPQRFSVVNIHAPGGYVYGLLRRLSPSKGYPPYVMTMHGLEERRMYAMSRESKKGRAWYFNLKNRLWHRVYHLPSFFSSIKTADYAICLNREARSALQLKYKRESDRVWYIPNGVEDRFFISREYHPEPAFRLLYVGTWLDHKGVYYLRDAFQVLAAHAPALRLTIAGCLTPAEQVKSLFDPSVRPQIDVIPFVSSTEMTDLYGRHDIFVFPSLVEGMPLVLLEAMATGMPVVTTETCGMMDVVEDGVNGLLVPAADASALTEAIGRLVECADLRRRLGQAAQETMRRYTWDKIARKVEKVFALAAQNGKP